MKVSFTLMTSDNSSMTKTVKPDGKGGIEKISSANMTSGTSETIKLPFKKLGKVLRSRAKNQCIVHGVAVNGRKKNQIVLVYQVNGTSPAIARSKEFFGYLEGPGLGMFDHDPKPGQKSLNVHNFLAIIASVWPDFDKFPIWWTPSTSSCIYDSNGKQLTGESAGFHLYFPVPNASLLPHIASILFDRLWLKGYGYIFLTKDGKRLLRTIFDASVFSPERLDFVAGANCVDCEQRLPDPVYRKGTGSFKSVCLPEELTESEKEQCDEIKCLMFKKYEKKSEKVEKKYVRKRAKKTGHSEESTRREIYGDLGPEVEITFNNGSVVAVRDILDNREYFDGWSCADPLEPSEGTSRAKFYANVNCGSCKPLIFSQLHGGRNYFLKKRMF